MRRLLLGLALAVGLAGCSQSLTNRPWGPYPTYDVLASQVVVQVDQNGDFYPDHWQTEIGDQNLHDTLSIALSLPREGREQRLAAFKEQALTRVRRAVAGRERVFVLIHGFNAEAGAAGAGADIVKQTIDLTEKDAVIELNWDGLRDAGGDFTGAVIWVPSTTTSQQAGTRALRPILEELSGRKVVLVTHSRGSSVVLSAFSNPNYLPSYTTKTEAEGLGYIFDTPTIDFSQRDMEADAIFLAPAIGEPDFWSEDCRDTPTCLNFRTFPGLRSVRYTVNTGDDILQKRFFTWNPFTMPCRTNPTGLGVGECIPNLVPHYQRTAPGWLRPYEMTSMRSHSYICYAGHPVLRRMLADVGVSTRAGLAETVAPPVTCDPAFKRATPVG